MPPRPPRKPARKNALGRSRSKRRRIQSPTPAAVSISLRPCTDADDAFVLAATRETMKEVFEKSVGIPLTDPIILSQIKHSGTTLIIEHQGQPIGYTCYTVYKQGYMYWGALVLIPSAQDRGIGSRICREMFDHARALGCHVMQGHVQVENEVAIKFWKNNGFEIVGGPTQGSYEIEKKL